jgi:hypothetical protein
MQRFIDKEWKKGLVIFAGLVLFHISFSVLLSVIARSAFLADLHNGQGIWNFAPDSVGYHKAALRLLDYLKDGDYGNWWASSTWWHVKWIALSYAVITPDPLSFAPVNGLTWAVSVVCVYKIVRQLFPGHRHLALLAGAIFGLWPSYLFQSTQLLKDPLYSMGILTMVYGWVALLLGKRGIGFSILVCFGVLLAHLNRTYILEALVFLTLLATVFVLWRKRETLTHALLACVLVLGLYAYEHRAEILLMFRPPPPPPTVVRPPVVKDPWRYEDWMPDWFESRIKAIINTRLGWATSYPEAGSNIDTDVRFYSVGDVVKYIPRALQIGFLAPFPRHWFEEAKVAGGPSRVFAAIEMMVWYLLIPGFLYFIAGKGNPIQIRLWLLIYSGCLVLLTALVVTNIGALYRMRFVYFLPILIGGLEGWARFYARRFQKAAR